MPRPRLTADPMHHLPSPRPVRSRVEQLLELPQQPGYVRPRQEWSARIEPFESYGQNLKNLDAGYRRFETYYRANYLPHIPRDRGTRIAVLSCGPGYLVHALVQAGYTNVQGIDASPRYIEHAQQHDLPCKLGEPVAFLEDLRGQLDFIIPEQELNHLTLEETIDFLTLCRETLADGPEAGVLVYAINGGNPLTSPEHLSHNIDHFYSVTEYSLEQILVLAGFTDVRPFPCELYVFWKNPANYVGWAVTHAFEFTVRVLLRFYGKRLRILSKRIAATARTRPPHAETPPPTH